MDKRIGAELDLLRKDHPDLEYREDGRWVRIPGYALPQGWSRSETDVAFQIKVDYPGTPPYGFFVSAGLTFRNERPGGYNEPGSPQPPFDGTWGMFSWQQEPNAWRPTGDVATGSNLRNFVRSFADRFAAGK